MRTLNATDESVTDLLKLASSEQWCLPADVTVVAVFFGSRTHINFAVSHDQLLPSHVLDSDWQTANVARSINNALSLL